MRTTLDIDDDVLNLAKEIAAKERRSTGSVLSTLARDGFHAEKHPASPGRKRNGVPMLPRRQESVTLDHVRKIMDEEGI
ncbi:MAG: hypothetical protein ACKVI3_14740 [Verrucomicrobiia bacterium]|tara:strand:- start:3909 stop:4145 length:237 start_codon:yes stop_codon:yes gene_type:complete